MYSCMFSQIAFETILLPILIIIIIIIITILLLLYYYYYYYYLLLLLYYYYYIITKSLNKQICLMTRIMNLMRILKNNDQIIYQNTCNTANKSDAIEWAGQNDDGSTIFIQTASIINAYDESYNGKRMCSSRLWPNGKRLY